MTTTTMATSSTRVPVTHTVEVGKAAYTISPDIVLAEVGDYIEYEFYPRNHSIVRADFEYPCIPYEMVNTSPGFYSGFQPVDAILDDPPVFTIRVNDTDPIFVYCSGIGACMEYGMVAVVNPNATTSLDVHRAAALQATYELQPGDRWPSEGPDPAEEQGEHDEEDQSHPTSTASSSGTATSTPAPAATSIDTATNSHSSLSPGVIAGIAIGAAAIALLAAIAIWICGRKSRKSRNPDASDGSWSLGLGGGTRKDPSHSGVATPATVPPAYYPHGLPVMTQANKAYPGQGGINTSIVEQYGPAAMSPPMAPQMFPAYTQHNVPPHVLDPAAFSHNSYGIPPQAGLAQNPPYQPPPPPEAAQQQIYRPEIYSGTPAPRSSMLQEMSDSGRLPGVLMTGRESMNVSHGSYSRGGSPDFVNEMNAMNRSPGTINQGGGARPEVHEPVPERADVGMDIKRLDVGP